MSIDGGGIKGVFPASFLAEVEAVFGITSVAQYFDLIAGTSVGGILALGLGLGLTARQITEFLVNLGPGVFPPGAAPTLRLLLGLERYDPGPLRRALSKLFDKKTLADSQVRLLIPSFDAGKADIHAYKTAHSNRLMMDHRIEAVEVAMATAAAPTYFPAYESDKGLTLVDGGVWANNPVALAVVEAIALLGQDPGNIDVLSLGCTEEPLDFKAGWHTGWYWLRRGIFAAMRGQSRSALGMAMHLTGRDRRGSIRLFDPSVSASMIREKSENFGGWVTARLGMPHRTFAIVFLRNSVSPLSLPPINGSCCRCMSCGSTSGCN
ncbi:MAG TPA: CBASS cGAMP-activated phospholipase [Terriglobales bacterium]|nr:CBASS cGAMP-activated phospholipase [Terriglobales bacterium]